MDLEVVRQLNKCPACGPPLPEGKLTAFSSCEKCGIVFAKFKQKAVNDNLSKVARARRMEPKAEAAEEPPVKSREARIQAYIDTHRKSPLTAFLLALFLGPLAMFYVSIPGALMMILLIFGLAFSMPAVGGLLGIVFWLLSLIAVPLGAINYNEKKKAEAELIAG